MCSLSVAVGFVNNSVNTLSLYFSKYFLSYYEGSDRVLFLTTAIIVYAVLEVPCVS